MSASYVLGFLYSQFLVTPPAPKQRFDGQTVIVTGSNTGLGLQAALHITRLGAKKVILAVRNLEKGEKAKTSIEESTGSNGVVEVWQLDLTSYESVKQFAKKAERLKRLDVLLENAGLMNEVWSMAEEDELSVTTNVVSTFLLGLLLLPKLQETATRFNVRPRLVIVSSDLHFVTNLEERKASSIFDELREKETAVMSSRYVGQTFGERRDLLIVRELAARIDQSEKPKVIVNCLTPGFCHSDFDRELTGAKLYFMKVMRFLIARSTEVGSRTLVAAAEAGEESHGQYMADSRVS
ncbi:MAG: hypothetical protein LQ343_000200 [Gyalolechia ehrenbergii]|nr:MAG: hypothetical protein LQ343_000200 [Gyalolechia ehrenbergii]